MKGEDSQAPMKMAELVVGSSKLFSRSRSSVHQHAKLVSLKRAAQHEPVNETTRHPGQRQQHRSQLMGRFRVKESARARKKNMLRFDGVLPGTPDTSRQAQPATYHQLATRKLHLINQIQSQLFPHPVGPNQGLLAQLLERRIYGQEPRALNSENARLSYATEDFALLHGLLSLASLSHDLSMRGSISLMSLVLKGRTIQSVRKRLTDSVQANSLGTIGAVASLAAFELLETYDDAPQTAGSINFLNTAIRNQGGLKLFGQKAAEHCDKCYLMRRALSWLDCSYAILQDVSLLYANGDLPAFLPYRTSNASMERPKSDSSILPFWPLLLSLSHLSRLVDHKSIQSPHMPGDAAQELTLGDQICFVEQYLVGLYLDDVSAHLVCLVRLTSFLYIAKFVRMLPRKSRILAQLVSKMEKAVTVNLPDPHINSAHTISLPAWTSRSRGNGLYTEQSKSHTSEVLRLLFFCATVASIDMAHMHSSSAAEFAMIGRQEFWPIFLTSVAQDLHLDTIAEATNCLDRVVEVTKQCKQEAAQAFEAIGLRQQAEE